MIWLARGFSGLKRRCTNWSPAATPPLRMIDAAVSSSPATRSPGGTTIIRATHVSKKKEPSTAAAAAAPYDGAFFSTQHHLAHEKRPHRLQWQRLQLPVVALDLQAGSAHP